MLKEIDRWLESKELEEQDWILSQGLRYTSQTIRAAGYYIAGNTRVRARDLGFEPHPSPLVVDDFSLTYKESISFYLWFIDAITTEEANHFLGDIEKAELQLSVEVENLFLKKDDRGVRNVVRPDIETVAQDIENIRKAKDNTVVVLNHGKWNTFPHLGYMFMYLAVMDELKERGYPEENIVFVIANDTNKDIKLSGSVPLLNTAWRASFNAYMPYDFICSSGDFDSWEEAPGYWTTKYGILKPDYVVVNPKDRLAKQRIKQVQQAGTQVLKCNSVQVVDTDERGRPFKRTGIHTSDLKSVLDLDLMTYVGVRNWLLQEKWAIGAFDRKANWRDFLMERGLL